MITLGSDFISPRFTEDRGVASLISGTAEDDEVILSQGSPARNAAGNTAAHATIQSKVKSSARETVPVDE